MPSTLISAEHVTISYDGQPAVTDVTFDIYPGENLSIVGANGSGKSTLLMGLLGLVKLDSGSIRRNCDNRRISYLPQIHTIDHNFPATVWEIVLSGTQAPGRRLPFYTKADRENAEKAIALLKIEDLTNKRIGDMSGGQQQRVLLARALSRNPALLILDEPCSALDPQITAELYDLFESFKKELGIAMVISTHDWIYVSRAADRVLELNNTIAYLGSVDGWPHAPDGRRA